MSETRTASILQRLLKILDVTAAYYGLPVTAAGDRPRNVAHARASVAHARPRGRNQRKDARA